MKRLLEKGVSPREIAAFLSAERKGEDFEVHSLASLQDAKPHTLVFSKNTLRTEEFTGLKKVCFLVSVFPDSFGDNAFILTANPRLAYAKVASRFFMQKKAPSIGADCLIDSSARIAATAVIGRGCVIGANVRIGEDTELRHHVVIADNVKVGKGCLIKSHAVIGEEGFGFDFEDDGTPVRVPHIGGVVIQDYVEIGALTSIARGTLRDTIIGSHVKIDDHVFIAHNCVIGEKSVVIAKSEVSGSVEVGPRCWLAPGCTIKNKLRIGARAMVGMGAVVLQDVPAGAVVVGNPARILRMRE